MKLVRAFVCILLCLQFALAQTSSASQSPAQEKPAAESQSSPQQEPAGKTASETAQPQANGKSGSGGAPQVTPALTGFGLEDGTPVKLRLTRNLSSATEKTGDTVDFEVVEDVNVNGTLVIPRGSTAWATVTDAHPKRRMGRGGKLDVNIDKVRLKDGEKVALRAVKENQGGGHVGAMTGAMVATGIVFFPAAPLFLFMHGKDINIPKGTEITAYVSGNIPLEKTKFQDTDQPQNASSSVVATAQPGSVTAAEAEAIIALVSTPAGADVAVDDAFVGNSPAKLRLKPGKHTIKITMAGYKDWSREMTVMSGSEVNLAATLEKTN